MGIIFNSIWTNVEPLLQKLMFFFNSNSSFHNWFHSFLFFFFLFSRKKVEKSWRFATPPASWNNNTIDSTLVTINDFTIWRKFFKLGLSKFWKQTNTTCGLWGNCIIPFLKKNKLFIITLLLTLLFIYLLFIHWFIYFFYFFYFFWKITIEFKH